mmetsp:Transcript_31571/g.36308  ORF Transcript_31571/g.36308 Transcript_31571/m.36308 type:complete len:300 (-) Transcript_31571:138-1037(-)
MADKYYDGTGFFSFEDDTDWSSKSIKPTSCIIENDEHKVVYNMYKDNNQKCQKHKMGTYKTDVKNFIKAYAVQQARDSEITGYKFEPGDAMNYLYCTAEYINDYLFYLQLGCSSTGKGFQVNAYKDSSCMEQAVNYNPYIDVSGLQVGIGSCKNCQLQYGNNYGYNNGNNYYNMYNNGGGQYYGNNNGNNGYFMHKSPMCAAAYNYKETCGYKCKNLASKVGSNSSSGMSGVQGLFLFMGFLAALALCFFAKKAADDKDSNEGIEYQGGANDNFNPEKQQPIAAKKSRSVTWTTKKIYK